MKNKLTTLKNKTIATASHVHRNRGKYAAATTAAGFLVLMNYHTKQVDAFLNEKGLYDEYYQTDED